MKTRKTIKLVLLMVPGGAACYWAGYVHGSSSLRGAEIFIGFALLLLFLLVLAKAIFAIIFRRGSDSPPDASGGGRGRSPDAPVPRVPGGSPPVLSATAGLKHESSA